MPDSLSILWVKAGYLYPLNTGGRKRSHAMLERINRQHSVTFLALVPDNIEASPEDRDGSYADDKIFVPWTDSKQSPSAFAIDVAANLLFSTLPLSLSRYQSEALKAAVLDQCRSGNYDLVICDFLTPAPDFADLDLDVPTVLFQHNVESDIWRRLARSKTNPLARLYFSDQHQRMEQAERQLSRHFAGIVTVSPEDSENFRENFGLTNVLGDVPTGVDGEELKPDPDIDRAQPPRIAFLGSMDWMPNIDAVRWFAADILPRIRRHIPEVEFHIIGRSPTAAVRRLGENDDRIFVSGTVPEVQPLLQACTAMVVPLLAGGGTRIKILEAMAMGVPVVSTRIGAEGLPVIDDEDILLADEADNFAAATVRALQEPETAARLAAQARARVIANHSWESVAERFIDLCSQTLRA